MNIYRIEFFTKCPNNGIRIKYTMSIETFEVVPVEQILAAVDTEDDGFHEDIANRMFERFGGKQIITADHHGVTIETIRS